MTKHELIIETLENMNDDDLIAVWNEYSENIYDYESRIYYMSDLNDLFYGLSATDILDAIYRNEFDMRDDFFHETAYGIASIECPRDYIYFDDIASYMIDYGASFYNDDLNELIESEEYANAA